LEGGGSAEYLWLALTGGTTSPARGGGAPQGGDFLACLAPARGSLGVPGPGHPFPGLLGGRGAVPSRWVGESSAAPYFAQVSRPRITLLTLTLSAALTFPSRFSSHLGQSLFLSRPWMTRLILTKSRSSTEPSQFTS
jgi:hypothetical protein